jgi:hypothetical protein
MNLLIFGGPPHGGDHHLVVDYVKGLKRNIAKVINPIYKVLKQFY